MKTSDLNGPNETSNNTMVFRTKYPTYLPADFTVDECIGVPAQATGLLNDEFFQCAKMIGMKTSINQLNQFPVLNDDEQKFIQ